jgi:hypothetical protein
MQIIRAGFPFVYAAAGIVETERVVAVLRVDATETGATYIGALRVARANTEAGFTHGVAGLPRFALFLSFTRLT